MSSPALSALRGVCSAGLSTTVLPQAKAGAIFQMNMSRGKFQGMICLRLDKGFMSHRVLSFHVDERNDKF